MAESGWKDRHRHRRVEGYRGGHRRGHDRRRARRSSRITAVTAPGPRLPPRGRGRGRRRFCRPISRTWARSMTSGPRRVAGRGWSDRRSGQQCRHHAPDGRHPGSDRGLGRGLGRGDGRQCPCACAPVASRGLEAGWTRAKRGAIIGDRKLGHDAGHVEPRCDRLCRVEGRDRGGDQDRGAELCRPGILAYVIAPGVVRTQMSVDSAAMTGGEAAVTATLPMGEWVPPSDIGRAGGLSGRGPRPPSDRRHHRRERRGLYQMSLLGSRGSRLDRVDDPVEFLHQRHHLRHPLAPFRAKAFERRDRRAHVAHRVSRRRRQRLGIALVPVKRMACGDDRVELRDDRFAPPARRPSGPVRPIRRT